MTSIFASVVITASKFVAALFTGSLGLLSEALHSFLDLVATVMTYLAVRVSDKPADADHHYGHGKVESVTALGEAGLLVIASFWVIYEALRRLITGETEVEASWAAIAVIVATIAIDYWRARALAKVAKETKSHALEADALHFASDMWTSFVVLAGLCFVSVGYPVFDAIAALLVSVFICRVAWKLGKKTFDDLIDKAPEGVAEKIQDAIKDLHGIIRTERIRVRPSGSAVFVDIYVDIHRGLSFGQTEEIKHHIVSAVKANISEAEVTVSLEPVAVDKETVQDKVSIIAANLGAKIHHIVVHFVNSEDNNKGRLAISMDLEVSENMLLGEAHSIASSLEQNIRDEFGQDTEIETQIEPFYSGGLHGKAVSVREQGNVEALLKEAAVALGGLSNVHNVRVRQSDRGLIVICHARTDAAKTVSDVYTIVKALECYIQNKRTDIWRIVVHSEPFGEGKRSAENNN